MEGQPPKSPTRRRLPQSPTRGRAPGSPSTCCRAQGSPSTRGGGRSPGSPSTLGRCRSPGSPSPWPADYAASWAQPAADYDPAGSILALPSPPTRPPPPASRRPPADLASTAGVLALQTPTLPQPRQAANLASTAGVLVLPAPSLMQPPPQLSPQPAANCADVLFYICGHLCHPHLYACNFCGADHVLNFYFGMHMAEHVLILMIHEPL